MLELSGVSRLCFVTQIAQNYTRKSLRDKICTVCTWALSEGHTDGENSESEIVITVAYGAGCPTALSDSVWASRPIPRLSGQ